MGTRSGLSSGMTGWKPSTKLAVTGLALCLAACSQNPPPVFTPTPPVEAPANPAETPIVPPVTSPVTSSMALDQLPGWDTSDAFITLEALRSSCTYKGGANQGTDFAALCVDLKGREFNAALDIKSWLNDRFEARPIAGEGLLTAYFVPEYEATTAPTPIFNAAVRPRPTDLVMVDPALITPKPTGFNPGSKVAARKSGDAYVPYYSRAEIEAMPVNAELYMRAEDYFYMQLQGSAFLTLPDGSRVLAAYAADNGLPFTGIARPMVEKGLLAKDQASGDNIRTYLAAHRGPEAQAIMNLNPRYAFFSIDHAAHEPRGAAGVSLPPGSAVAIDPAFHSFGDLLWVDADSASLSGAQSRYQRLVSALDTGGAIKGEIRADLYTGIGERAGTEAGKVRHKLRFYRLSLKPHANPQ